LRIEVRNVPYAGRAAAGGNRLGEAEQVMDLLKEQELAGSRSRDRGSSRRPRTPLSLTRAEQNVETDLAAHDKPPLP